MKSMKPGVIEKQPPPPVLLINMHVADPCFQTPLQVRRKTKKLLRAVKRQLGTWEARKTLARPDVWTTALSGSLLVLQGGFCVLGLGSHCLGRSLVSHPVGATFRREQVGSEHADSTNQMRPALLIQYDHNWACAGVGRVLSLQWGQSWRRLSPLASTADLCGLGWVSDGP